jgi:hypothetical protein
VARTPAQVPDSEFLVRYRMPRPISRAYESVCFAVEPGELAARSRWCARVAVRFVAALRQAALLAARGGGSVNPPAPHDLRAPWPPEVLGGGPGGQTWPVERLAAQEEVPGGADSRLPLRDALDALADLAGYRLVIAGDATWTVLLGPRMEYTIPRAPGSSPRADEPQMTPLLLDPRSGAYLSLAPLLIWEKTPECSFGRLFLLRRVEGRVGHYVEDGVPGCPGCSRPLSGMPRAGRLRRTGERLDLLASPPARFRDGSLLEPHFLVEGLIWRGGTSDIFAARRLPDGRPFVLKTFEYEPGVFDENFWRFLGEAQLSQGIRHPGVIGSQRLPAGPWGIVHAQPLARRGSLRDQLENNGVLPAGLAVQIGLELLDALSAVHAAGVAHNDVKPDNILFDEDGELRLIDFGIAAPLAVSLRALRPGAPAGSAGYMAPELRAGARPSAASDLYAAGAVLVQMLTGRLPEQPATGLPGALEPVLARLVDPRPEARFRSAEQARTALAAGAAAGLPPVRAIALDMEGTLVPNYHDRRPRDGLREFLEFCLAGFDRLFVYTLLSRTECAEVFATLAGAGALPPGWLERHEYVEWPRGADGSLKDLRRCRVPLSQIALVDDMEQWVPEDQAHRWVPVPNCAEVLGVDRGLVLAREQIRALFGGGGTSA